jgi:non-ribosomal peptide synthetase component F
MPGDVTTTGRPAASSKERALWLLEQLVPESGLNNIGVAFKASGALRRDALEAALAILLSRYETLRTVFFDGHGELLKELIPAKEFAVAVEPLELPGPEPAEGLGGAGADLSAFVGAPFAFDGHPLVRAGLASCPDGDVFCLAIHHLVFDGISAAIFLRQFIPVYDSIAAGRPLPAGASATQEPLREPEPRAAALTFWRENLRGFVPDGLDLWCGSPRRTRPTMAGGTVMHVLAAETHTAVQRLQREVRAPAAAILLAAYFATLAAHGAGPDLVVGSPLDVRGPQAAAAVGYHVNVVPLRLRVDFGESFRQLARRTRDVFLAAMANADVSVDDLAAELPRLGSSWQTTLYRHMFNLLPEATGGELTVAGQPAALLAAENGFSKFDLELFVIPSATEIRFRVRYRTEILARDDVEAFLRRYEAFLLAAAAAADRPVSETAGWTDQDRAIIDQANGRDRAAGPASVPAAILAQVRAAPQAAAVTDSERTLTYHQLWTAAVAVRDQLAGAGTRPGDVVALLVARTAEAAVGLLGSWLAGAAVLFLDTGEDAAGQAGRLRAVGAALLLTSPGTTAPAGDGLPPARTFQVSAAENREGKPAIAAGELPAPLSAAVLVHGDREPGPGAATVLSHAGLAATAAHFAAELAAGPATGTLALAPFAGTGALLELCLPLSTAGRAVIAPDTARRDGLILRDLVVRHDIGIVQPPPALPGRLLEAAIAARPGLRVLVPDAQLPASLAIRLTAAGAQLHNVYGAAETGGWALSSEAGGQGGRARGRPIAGIRAHVAGPDGRELPVGVRGELCLTGDSIARGYHDDPELSRLSFSVAGPHGWHYRTGELARWRPDGTIERLGPIGGQAVVDGHLVNPGDAEAALRDHASVRAAAVLAVDSPDGDDELVAFAEVCGLPGPPDRVSQLASGLREHLRASLPPAAVPRRVICLDTLPAGPRGQADRDALIRLARSQPSVPAVADDAEGLVSKLVELWRELLGPDVTPDTDFFGAGGFSLLAARLAQDIEECTGLRVELPEIFAHPTPTALAARLAAIRAETGDDV